MKPTLKEAITAFIILLFISTNAFSQTNTLPASGNVGIGTTSPTTRLQVNGTARIDSSLMVQDSMVVQRGATVYGPLRVTGSSFLVETTTIDQGDLIVHKLIDSTSTTDGVVLVDSTGKVKNGGDLKSLVYADVALPPCKDDAGGNISPAAPVWLNGPGKLYTSNACVPDVKVGIGQNNPESKLHITSALNKTTHPIIVDKRIQGTTIPYKLMELDNNGLLYAREVKVNLDSWPDYVFDENYRLMPLNELQVFIQENNHLPDVPSACEMEASGINVAQSNVMLMEKVEELTLYMLQLNEQLQAQKALLDQQQETIRLQQELLRQIQQSPEKP